jgi:hypothetical protein
MGRYALSGCIAAVMLSACGMPASPQSAAIATPAERGRAWMLPEANDEDLLYVATGDNVYVLSYPGGKLTGSLNAGGHNLCADAKGDVFVPTGYDVAEYSHGGTLIQTLDDGDVALGCSVDPVTGNLAVTNEGSGCGEVAIFPKARDPEQWYRDPAICTYGLDGYDDRGNLFFDGTGSSNYFAELPKGSSTFKNYVLTGNFFTAYGSVQWDRGAITLTNPSSQEIYRLKPSASTLKIIGSTHASGWQNPYSGQWPYVQTWLQGGRFIAQASTLAEIGSWRYPAGGNPKNVSGAFKSGTVDIYGIAVSLAKH